MLYIKAKFFGVSEELSISDENLVKGINSLDDENKIYIKNTIETGESIKELAHNIQYIFEKIMKKELEIQEIEILHSVFNEMLENLKKLYLKL